MHSNLKGKKKKQQKSYCHMKTQDWAINTDLGLKRRDMLQTHQIQCNQNSDNFLAKGENFRKLFENTH